MHITRLRLLGFKSFVEPAELLIERGLTGVVGPNGCGKSNLLEALRWVMGETSYKNMRASSMDDVIFSGTATRPSRNIAEVAISLDNSARAAPAAFNDSDQIEISRRIERDSGSDYRINGRLVRARDVQLLFADASTGARSPALVQQGRIGEIINAKPAQRRLILEEAAGISGLHSRRHEAEIKLRAAEENLTRLLDIMGQMDSRLGGLKRQQRQVKRYRELSREVERLQAMLHYINWFDAGEQVSEAEKTLAESLSLLGERTSEETGLRNAQTRAAEDLPGLREQEMVAAAVLQRISIEAETLEKEQKARARRIHELEERTRTTSTDIERERGELARENQHQAAQQDERSALALEDEQTDERLANAGAQVEQAHEALQTAESTHIARSNQLAEDKARRAALERQLAEQQAGEKRIRKQQRKLAGERAELTVQLAEIADFDANERELAQSRAQLDALVERHEQQEFALEKARTGEREARSELEEARSQARALSAQIDGLAKLLPTVGDDKGDAAILEAISVTPGYETALGAALGDDLDAPLSASEETSLSWRDCTADFIPMPLPNDCIPLAQLVEAPDALSPRLKMTGVIDRGSGDELQTKLKPGQRLVSVEGDLWRWDGFFARADAPTPAARRLAAQNQLAALKREHRDARIVLDAVEEDHLQADETLQQAALVLETGKSELKTARRQHEQRQRDLDEAQRRAASQRARLQALGERDQELAETLATAARAIRQSGDELVALPALEALSEKVSQSEQELAPIRSLYHEAKAAHDRLTLEMQTRRQRIQTLDNENKRLEERRRRAEAQIKALLQRLDADEEALQQLKAEPAADEQRRQKLLDEQQKAEARRKQAADQLAEAENALREITRSLDAAQRAAADAREERARRETRLEGARLKLAELEQLIHAEMDCAPEDCLKRAEHAAEQLPMKEDISRRLAKFQADRERLGSINLRADEETLELEQQLKEMQSEHEDLTGAINTLRTAINGLNREGRKRLLAAFEEINTHFEKLFTTLFGGGEASLELIESDDPLQAGLEIVAKPPGKKPQVLTLLSGGEKALTAMSLIFAVFLTNPAPICVLDEVDAPLDDANVERFCALMDEMTRQTDTRFLIITHHPATMARMDRLFGLTMAEKGVSQLVSVDLSTAESYRETA